MAIKMSEMRIEQFGSFQEAIAFVGKMTPQIKNFNKNYLHPEYGSFRFRSIGLSIEKDYNVVSLVYWAEGNYDFHEIYFPMYWIFEGAFKAERRRVDELLAAKS